MIDIILYTLLAIIIIVIICILAYYIADYLDNKKDTDAKFNKTSDYINKNFHNIDNELIVTTNYINSNLINVNKNIKISDTNLTKNMNKINNDLTTNMSKINNDLLDNIVNTSNVLTNNIINTSNIFSDQIKNNDKKFDNIDDNLSRYFSFSSATDTNYLLNKHLLSDISTAKLNVLTQVNFNSDLAVHGKIAGKSIFSENEITCATGLRVGIESPDNLGAFTGITTLGGINSGPIAAQGPTVPGVIKADALVTAPAIVGTTIVVSPIVFGGVLLDVVGGAPTIRALYDIHNHIAPLGPTTITTVPMPLP